VLLDDQALERSSVVANCAMNRDRRLTGYGRELGLDVAGMARERIATGFRWVDLCCGAGKALLECATLVDDPRLRISGVDLVDFFATPTHPGVRFETAAVASWAPAHAVDLVTCVHGLHYVGDKLGLLTRAASWLADDGLLVANLATTSIRSADGTPLGRRLTTALRSAGFQYDGRNHRIRSTGNQQPRPPFHYLGADDQAGPNYTGQPAVHSYYES